MLSRLASIAPKWARAVSSNAPWMYVSAGVYFLGIHFHEEVATLLVVEGASMRPTLNPDSLEDGDMENSDICLLKKWRYQPSRGDVVCLHAPRRSGAVVKRIVALSGDTVTPRDSNFHQGLPLMIPIGHVWVEGDNEANSIDSNSYGPVPVGMIIGRVSHVLYRQNSSSSKSNLLIPIPSQVNDSTRFQQRELGHLLRAQISSSSPSNSL